MENLLEILDSIDRSLFVFLNALHHPYLDVIMLWVSDRFIWVPFYAFLLFLIVRQFKKESPIVFIFIAILVIFTDQITSEVLKPVFERLRPCHNEGLKEYVHIVGKCGGRYGFISSHAANTFGIAAFLWLLLRDRYAYFWLMFIWAGIISFSRIYLGVHYPGDIIFGGLFGFFSGLMFFEILSRVRQKRGNITEE